MQGLNPEYVALGIVLAVALFFFWTQKLRTDLTALLAMLALVVPWPHPDGHWHGILTYQEGFSGFLCMDCEQVALDKRGEEI